MARQQVAESCLSYLQMELMRLALGPDPDKASTSQLQNASRIVESIGFAVGVRLAERYTKDRPRFADTLEIIKFICKDFWVEVFRKQIDKLQTNNRVSCKGREGGGHLAGRGRCPHAHYPLHTRAVRSRLAGRVHAAGQLAPHSHPVFAVCRPRGIRHAACRRLRQVPRGLDSRRPLRPWRPRFCLSRGE